MAKQPKRRPLILYGTKWCPQSATARRLLDRQQVRYRYIDIGEDQRSAAAVMELANGNRSVPTFVLPDRRVLVEPSKRELCRALGLPAPRWWWPF